MKAIYKITNEANGKFYVGSSVDTRVRFQTHRRQLRIGNHHCHPLQRAWMKYGEPNFKFSIVEHVSAESDLTEAENRWLSEHHGKSYCYNISRFADAPGRGIRKSDRAKAAISAGNRGKAKRLGHTNSEDHNQRISAAMKGKKKSPEHVEKIRQRMIGTSYAKGRVVTEEEREARGKRVVEVASGLEFATIVLAAEHFGIQRSNLIRALRDDRPLKRGPNAGLHFRYALPPSPA